MVLSSETTTQEILEKISKKVNVALHQLDPVMIKEHKIRDHLSYAHTAKYISDHEGILFVQQLQKTSTQLQKEETHILLYYVKRETQSYVRQLVYKRQGTVGDLFIRIYLYTRPHIINFIVQSSERVFPASRVQDFTSRPILTEEEWNILLWEIQQLQQLKKFPFIVKLSDQLGKLKSQEIDQNDNTQLEELPQYLKIELLIADFIDTPSLKLQRCKQVQLDELQTQKLKNEYDLNDCINSFTKQEVLGQGDEWYCGNCKKHVQASKKMEIYKAPKILIFHLKRFKTNRISNFGKFYFSGGSQKINDKIIFPVQNLNLNDIILSKANNDPINYTYDLFAVSNHMGGLNTGHYTAYALSPIKGQWIEYNDSQVRFASQSDIVSDAAYLLFYRRRDAQPCQILNFK